MNNSMQNRGNIRAVSVLNDFFVSQNVNAPAATQKRHAKVQQHLLHFLDEADMSGLLDLQELAALSVARRAGRGFFGAHGLEAAIACLPRFLEQEWLLKSSVAARAQIAVTGGLIDWLDRSGHLDPDLMGCALYEAEAAVRSAQKQTRSTGVPAVDPSKPRLTVIRGGLAQP